jgi:dihydroorotate dehydrogenase/Pyruvate/2-oxoacid:ferredoxin oxidoreductase delta subunit
MANLEINFAGLKMRGPIGIAPLNPAIAYGRNPTVQADWLMRHVEAGAGYIFVSATRPERSSPLESKPAIKFIKAECPGFAKREGILSTGDIMAIQFYLDKSLEVMSRLKQQLPKDVPIIAQPHVAGPDLIKWVTLCKLLEEAGADALELNFCPISIVGDEETDDEATKLINAVDTLEMRTLRKLGLAPGIGEIPEVLSEVVRVCVDAVNIPVGLKPVAEAGFPKCVALAKLAADAGAAYIGNVTAPLTVAPPNIYQKGRSPWEDVHFPINPFAGVSGPMDRYQCRKAVGTVALYVPEIEIMGIGGIVTSEQVVETMMLGAKTVALSSGFFWKGRKLLRDSISFLDRFMDEQGYESVDDLVGLGLTYVRPVDPDFDWEEDKIAAKVDKGKCSKCGTCWDSYCPVPVEDEDGYPRIDEKNCQGCGFCMTICPTEAISVVRL